MRTSIVAGNWKMNKTVREAEELASGFIGWGLSMILAGFLFFLVIFALVLVVTFGWTWLTGGG